jgi:hypothetical protein
MTGSARHSAKMGPIVGKALPRAGDDLSISDINILARNGEHYKMQVFLARAFFVV